MPRTLLRRILDKVRRKKPTPAPAEKPVRVKKNTGSSFEPLEGRIAPATLLNATTLTFQDLDGDLVTVKFTKPLFNKTGAELTALLSLAFKFKDANGNTTTVSGNNNIGEQLQLLDITALANITGLNNPANGSGISITATKQGSGDGFTNVGYIKAATNDIFGASLGAVVVDGDLGQIDAGNNTRATGIASLTVQTLGALGLTTQSGVDASQESNVTGAIGKLVIKGDMLDAQIIVVDGTTSTATPGRIGSITIGGVLRVSDANTADDAGSITAEGGIGPVSVRSIFGGTGDRTGRIEAGDAMGSVKIAEDIRGGAGDDSGQITGTGIGAVSIGFNIWGGTGARSGSIVSGGNIGAIKLATLHGEKTIGNVDTGIDAATISAAGSISAFTVQSSVLGGKGAGSGSVEATGSIGKISILGTFGAGTITGGDGAGSGRISGGNIGPVAIKSAIIGGKGDNSGTLASTGNIGAVTFTETPGSTLVAGTGLRSGAISAGGNAGPMKLGTLDGSTATAKESSGAVSIGGNLASLTAGSFLGGGTELTGSVSVGGTLGAVKITGNLAGGMGAGSGSLITGGRLASATITGNLDGGLGVDSGSLIAGSDFALSGDTGAIAIGGRVLGDAGDNSGSIRAGGRIAALTIGVPGVVPVDARILGGAGHGSASIFGGGGLGVMKVHGRIEGAAGVNSASIGALGTIASLTISGAILGGNGAGSASIAARDLDLGTSFKPGDLGAITIGGGVTGGMGEGSASLHADGTAKTLTLGALTGGAGIGSAAIRTGQGASALADDFVKIGGATAITINGALANTAIDVGAKLGALTIKGAVTGGKITVGRDLGGLTITGAVSQTIFSAVGQVKQGKTTDVAFGKITTGAVDGARFLAGYDRFGNAVNADAQIGAVTVNGNWIASSIIAGAADVDADGFGDADDTTIAGGSADIFSKIASLTVTGTLSGTAAPGDHFGIVAQVLGAVKINNIALALTAAKDVIDLAGTPPTDDTTAREIA